MAFWITHLMIVDNLYKRGIDLDEKGFVVGNIAPDCNIENENWTEFIPPKEVTHWMNGESKLTADYEGFFRQYIQGKEFICGEHMAFLFGYYSHLITDVEFQKFVRNEERVKDIYHRIKNRENLSKEINGFPEDFDTLKKVFGRNNVLCDIIIQELNYLADHPDSKYTTVLKKVTDFPDYIDYLPHGAITRKISIMAKESSPEEQRNEFIFFSEDEFENFVENTGHLIYNLIQEKRIHMLPEQYLD